MRAQRGGSNGLILVFDLDETITNTVQPLKMNDNVFNILKTAAGLRYAGVDAIFLLTNNADRDYVASIDDVLLNSINSVGLYGGDDGMPLKEYFFDYIMTRNHPARRNGRKSMTDVMYMCNKIGMEDANMRNFESIMSRTYFFDDQEHDLSIQLKVSFNSKYNDHSIRITPPFTGRGEIDNTNYEPILNVLADIPPIPPINYRNYANYNPYNNPLSGGKRPRSSSRRSRSKKRRTLTRRKNW
jgi:hypothetical protein